MCIWRGVNYESCPLISGVQSGKVFIKRKCLLGYRGRCLLSNRRGVHSGKAEMGDGGVRIEKTSLLGKCPIRVSA